MSEKRFTLTDWHEVKDNGNIMTVDEVVGKLNEQQSTISALKEENKQLKEYCIVLKSQIKRMGELGGFNKHMIKTILESNYDE